MSVAGARGGARWAGRGRAGARGGKPARRAGAASGAASGKARRHAATDPFQQASLWLAGIEGMDLAESSHHLVEEEGWRLWGRGARVERQWDDAVDLVAAEEEEEGGGMQTHWYLKVSVSRPSLVGVKAKRWLPVLALSSESEGTKSWRSCCV